MCRESELVRLRVALDMLADISRCKLSAMQVEWLADAHARLLMVAADISEGQCDDRSFERRELPN